ncbi:hypothetical protein RHMOL_Rhmol11G0134500 [Rhododendron molle]|uniref:Uncharacterized protein n=1 Tax=Rhododendron molle TaxID=49168 RepID=A0ACC0LSZ9_RHOML|nr:hypothetical protein RHMOL_Rhmol11G0134500 [Rhododendron molle]
MLRTPHLHVPNSDFQNLASSTTNEDGGKEVVVGDEIESRGPSRQGGAATASRSVIENPRRRRTEAVVANPIAAAARTKPAAVSLVPPQRKSVKKMMGNATVKAIASRFRSTDQQKDKTHSA